jgi:hypothetical protein
MPRTNVEALLSHQPKRPFSRSIAQPPPEASAPAQRPRDGHQAARAPKKGQRPARRAAAVDRGGEVDGGGEGDGDGAAVAASAAVATALAFDEGAAAYARVRVAIEAVPLDSVRRLSVHVPSAVVLVLGALPKMLALRGVMRDTLVTPPFGQLDALRDYALAAAYAHACVLPRDEGETRLRALLTEAVPLRTRLLSSAETLVTFGLLDPREIASVRSGTGHVDTAQDLSALVLVLRRAGPGILAKTPLTEADLGRAGELGSLLLEALGHRRSGVDGAGTPEEAEWRLGQAFELMARTYDACRRVISFLRWNEGDADAIAPPLGHSRRRARRSPAEEPDGPTTDVPGSPPLEPPSAEAGESDVDEV